MNPNSPRGFSLRDFIATQLLFGIIAGLCVVALFPGKWPLLGTVALQLPVNFMIYWFLRHRIALTTMRLLAINVALFAVFAVGSIALLYAMQLYRDKSRVPPFNAVHGTELTSMCRARFAVGSSLSTIVRALESDGFTCARENPRTVDPLVLQLLPEGPNGELPYSCDWSRATSFGCGESWTVTLIPNRELLGSVECHHSDACL